MFFFYYKVSFRNPKTITFLEIQDSNTEVI